MAKFKKGITEWPETYLSLVFSGIGAVIIFAVAVPGIRSHETWTARFKKYYTVYRPDDPRVALYPKEYITDKEYLRPDHPEKAKDVKLYLLPKSEVHRSNY